MSKVGIIQIHDEIIRTNGQYCCICFRPGTERRLVKPEFLNSLISKLSNVVKVKNEVQVCYMCEGLAKSAVRFVKAVELATRVGELLSDVTKEQWVVIANLLDPKAKSEIPRIYTRHQDHDRESPPRRAIHLERELRSCPRYELYRTDTLVVSGGVAASSPAPAPVAQPRTDMVVVMQHEDPLSTMLPVLQQLPVMPPLVVPGLTQAVTSRLPQLSIDADRKHVRVVNKDTNEYILHPVVTGIDGNIYVPSLQLKIADNGILKSVDPSHMQHNLPSTFAQPTPNLNPTNLNNLKSPNLNSANLNSTNLKTPNLKTYNVNSTNRNSNLNSAKLNTTTLNSTMNDKEENKGKSAYYNFLVSQMQQKRDHNINNVEVIKMDDMNIVLNVDDDDEASRKKRKLEELDQTLSDVAHLLKENAQGACEISYEIIDDEDEVTSSNQGANSNQGASSNQGHMSSKSVNVSGNRVASGNHVSASSKSSNQGHTSSKSDVSGNRVASGNHVSAGSKGAGGKASSKEPVLRTDRTVDWEDKIPMDVISFMDATDPNPQERIMQPPPMGIISDVRSVPDVPDIECIDLC